MMGQTLLVLNLPLHLDLPTTSTGTKLSLESLLMEMMFLMLSKLDATDMAKLLKISLLWRVV